MAELLESGRNWLAGIVIVGALGAGVGLAYPLLQRPAAPPVQLVATPPAATPPAAEIQVHVIGAVEQPGLYALPAGSRVGEAVEAAGLAADAAPDALNLAARLVDGQRLVVPRQGEPAPAEPAPAPPRAASARATPSAPASGGRAGSAAATAPVVGAKLNLNTATVAQLDALPGIGPTYAQRIVDYRERNGPFRSVQQLHDARLIPNATFERIKERLAVE
ncbi:MAG TPA: ComEA family DNA-binding protein [Chloroflexota bacterium]|nr:ComEA family DNA-binding protein [Chloroflexota bacterium]